MRNKITDFIVDLGDFCYYSIYKNKGTEYADRFYKSQVKYLIAPYFLALLTTQAVLFFRLGIHIPDIADGNILIMIGTGLCVALIYNFLISPIEKIYNKVPIDIEKIKVRYRPLRTKFVVFFIVGIILIGVIHYIITMI